MNNSHRWFVRLPYSALYRFLQRSILSRTERIVGVKNVVRYGQILKEISILNQHTKNKYKIYLNAFGRCYPSSTGDIHSYIFVEDEKFERALPNWFKMMREVNNGIEIDHKDYVQDFYDYYNNSISFIYDGRLERMEKRGNYTEEQFEKVRNEKQKYYNKLCNIVRKYMPIGDMAREEEPEEDINYDDFDGYNPGM